MDRNIGLEAVRLTEAAAMASARLMGRGDEKAADQAAVDAMRKAFNELSIRGTIVIGEGERDEAPMLYIGEKVGVWGEKDPEVDIALDPLEGTTICATGGPNALSVIAMADKGNLLNAPDTYMENIAVGPSACALGIVNEIEGERKMGIAEPHRLFALEELAAGRVLFAATGVTSGDFLKGVRFFKGGATTQSVVMRSKSRTVRFIDSTHQFEHKPNYGG